MTIMENKMKGKNNNNHNHSHPTINSHRGQLFVAQFLSRSQNPRALLLSRTADKACAWHCRFKGGLSNLMFGSIFHHFFSGFCVFLVFVPGFPGICSGIVGVLCVCVCLMFPWQVPSWGSNDRHWWYHGIFLRTPKQRTHILIYFLEIDSLSILGTKYSWYP